MYRNTSDAVNDMRDRGFNGFELSGKDLFGTRQKMNLQPDEFMIVESHRFCMPAGRGPDIFIYGIVVFDPSIKGILISHCSAAGIGSLVNV